ELTSDAHHTYDQREEQLGADAMREFERRVVMAVLDRKWREHLYEMDYLQEGIGLRAMAQRDPLVEYQREGFHLFEAMMDSIKEESVAYLFNVEVQVTEPTPAPAVTPVPVGQLLAGMAGSSPQDASADIVDVGDEDEIADDASGPGASFRRPVIQAKGLDGPTASRLHYSAPSDSGGVEERDVDTRQGTGPRSGPSGNPANRAQQRRSSKKARRRGR
ncbi:MAG TPA: preprotein translocase subunit SecA, partial [Dermatophilaceae bacterium]|nr:preprotein translocase subunit SecA [Dermatophilaceae bacterium]